MRRLYPLLLGVFVTGCGSVTSEVFQTVGQPLQTPTPVVEPTPALPSDPAVAAQFYLSLTTAYNLVFCEQSAVVNSGDLEHSKATQAAAAEATRSLADDLRFHSWGLEGTKQDLLHALTAVERTAWALATSATVEKYNAQLVVHLANQRIAGGIRNSLSGELGLESTPGYAHRARISDRSATCDSTEAVAEAMEDAARALLP